MIVSIMHQDQNQSNEQSVQRKQKILPDPVNFISHSNAGMDQSSEKGSRRSSVTGSGRSEQIRSLRDIVRQESQSRQETDELYQRLQHEYDSLLAKYAQAENTIDQLRIGAKINLFSDGPTLNQAREIVYVDHTAKSPQRLSFPKRDQAMISDFQSNSALDDRIRIRSTSDTAHDGCSASPDRDTVRTPEASIESVKLGVLLKLRDLQDDIAAFQSALAERELNYVEQRDLYSALKSQHEQLKAQLQNASNGDKKTTDGATSTDTGIR